MQRDRPLEQGALRLSDIRVGHTDFNVIALSRRIRPETDGLQWRSCDLYDLDSCIGALKGVDSAVYLVHSMMPSARLTQASFEDLDLILADNFARAAQQNGIKHIVYVGGLDPDTPDTSIHLSSRGLPLSNQSKIRLKLRIPDR